MMSKGLQIRRFIAPLIFAALLLAVVPLRADDPPQRRPPIRWGVNYWLYPFTDGEIAQLRPLAIGALRYGGDDAENRSISASFTQMFAGQARVLGAEPVLNIGLLRSTVREAVDLVTEINVEKNLGIRYWSIGNEPELYKATHRSEMTIAQYTARWREYAEAMLATDPSILLVGPDISYNLARGPSPDAQAWMDAFLKANGDLIKVLTIHTYPYGPDEFPPEAVLRNPDDFARNLQAFRQYVRERLGRDVPIWITEINLNYQTNAVGAIDSGSLYAGLWLAQVMGEAAQQGVEGFFVWSAVRNGSLAVLGPPLRPTFYALRAFKGFERALTTAQTAIEGVRVYGGTNAQGDLLAVIVNRNDAQIDALFTPGAPPPEPSLPTIALGVLEQAAPTQVRRLSLGPHSLTWLHMDSRGVVYNGRTYGNAEFEANAGPNPIQY